MTDRTFRPLDDATADNARSGQRRRRDNVSALGTIHALNAQDGLYDPVAWDGEPIPGREWIVDGLIPCNTVTLLTGNGGEGKSLLGVQLLAAAVTSTKWLGRTVKRVRGMGIFCEDDKDELMRRTDGILGPDGLTFSDLDGLTFFDRDGKDSVMYEAEHNDNSGRLTNFFHRVQQTVAMDGAQILVLDSLYNFFGGNENSRPQVNQFIAGLKTLAKECMCAVVVVGHPSRAGMGLGGDGTSGNTAWHNAVRSRLYLHRKKHPGNDPDKKGPLVLEHMKSNYGQVETAIELMYDRGRFVPVQVETTDAPLMDKNWGARADEQESLFER